MTGNWVGKGSEAKRMKSLITIVIVAIFAVAASAQTTFNGITPAKTTKTEAEKILGAPLKKLSETLIEYSPSKSNAQEAAKAGGAMQVYIQYRQGSLIVERVAIVLKGPDGFTLLQHTQRLGPGVMLPFLDARVLVEKSGNLFLVSYVGSPYYYSETISQWPGEANIRIEFFSPELYQAAVPKGACNGTFIGKWNTNLGEITIKLADDQSGVLRPWAERKVVGTSPNATFVITGTAEMNSFTGKLKDQGKTGDLSLSLKGRQKFHDNKDFKGTFRIDGESLDIEGQCIE